MCIVVDDREHHIADELRKLNVEVSIQRLDFGDAMFSGNGPDGECIVAFERKRLSDLINSMKDRRLSGHQLRGLYQSADFIFLITEGIWKEGSGGEIEELRGREFRPFYSNGAGLRTAVSYEQLSHYLNTLRLKGGVHVEHTRDVKETARFYASQWRWFNQKRWQDHHSHDALYTNTPAKGHGAGWGTPHAHDEAFGRYGRGRAVVNQEPPTTLWRMCAQLPGLDRRAETVARHFGTVRGMAAATEKEWMGIDFGTDATTGRRNPGIGKVTAAAVIRAITEPGA